MMLSEEALLDSIFETVLRGCDVNVKARKNAIWNACLAMMADVGPIPLIASGCCAGLRLSCGILLPISTSC